MPLALLRGGRAWRFSALVANGCAQALAASAAALCIRRIFDELLRHWPGSPADVWAPIALFAAAAAVTAALKARERIDSEILGFDYTNDIRLELFDHLAAVSAPALERRSEGVVLLRFVGDLTAVKLWVAEGLARLTVAAVTAACVLIALAVMCAPAALAAGLSLALGCAAILGLSAPLEEAVRASRKRRGALSGLMAERIIAMRTVQSFGGAGAERERVARKADKLRIAIGRRAAFGGAVRASAHATAALAHLAVLIAAAYAVAHGRATAGTVLAAIMLIGALLPLLHELGGVFELWQSARVCHERVDELLAAEPVVPPNAETAALKIAAGEVRFDGVSYADVLDGVDLVAPGGSVIAITGPNGAGKSTLLALVSRLIGPTAGRVLLDGQDVARLTHSSLRDAVGVVSADLPLLRGSVEMNVRYRCPDAAPEELARVARLCGIEHLLTPAPNGKAQRLADRGRNLSLGERQRVLLARALLGTPAVLLLDEAEANLDESASCRIATLLETYPGTVLMVTHRPSWVRRADYVWRMEGGRVVQVVPQDGPTHPDARPTVG